MFLNNFKLQDRCMLWCITAPFNNVESEIQITINSYIFTASNHNNNLNIFVYRQSMAAKNRNLKKDRNPLMTEKSVTF